MIPTSKCNHGRTARRRCGFSLVELVVVIVLTAILAGAAIPAMSSLSGTRRVSAARQLARDLTFARERAQARGVTIWVSLNVSTDTYTMLEESLTSPGRSGATAMTDPATGRAFSQTFASGEFAGVDIASVSIGGGSGAEVGFDWLGRPKSQSETLITSTGTIAIAGGSSVTIEPETGFVKVFP